MERNKTIDCECGVYDRPVSAAFGDFVCKQANSSVKDIIKKFEGAETPGNLGKASPSKSNASTTPERHPSEGILEKRVVYEEEVPTPQRAVQMTIQEYFSKQSAGRSRDKISEKKSLYEKNKGISTNQQKPQGSFTDRNPFVSDTENTTYPSKTTICKTDFGVRIILDIHFDTRSKLDNWQGSRIETDIPSSEILSEFQKKMT